MHDDRAVLLCLSGLDTEDFIRHAARHLPEKSKLILLYVIDTRTAEERGYVITPLRPTPGPEQGTITPEEREAHRVLNVAESKLLALGFDPHATTRQVRKGRPQDVIIEVAAQSDLNIGLVVIGSNFRRGLHTGPGPRSMGGVARYVAEYSGCDVLLLR
jgi:nucleotide-binding universal stress UspA family protein